MIESIRIAKTASYGEAPEEMAGLAKLNYVYGSNGTGKTTISRLIADPNRQDFASCVVGWKNGTKLEARVYNADFIEQSFNQTTEMKGVFTLGEEQADTLAKIDVAKTAIQELTEKIENLGIALIGKSGDAGKRGELEVLETGFKDQCWAQKQKHDEAFQGAFAGVRANTEKFKARLLQEHTSNKSNLQTYSELLRKAESLFGEAPTAESSIPNLDFAKLTSYASDPVLAKLVLGKDDVDIAAMIRKLGNSDWVRQGRRFFDVSEGTCPFCQQSTESGFAQSLNEYFDETFVADTKAIEDLGTNYGTESARLQQQLTSIIASSSRFLDIDRLTAEKALLDALITVNIQRLSEKKKEASRAVELDSLANVVSAISGSIESANKQIADHNTMVSNLGKEQAALTSAVWKFVLEGMKSELTAYENTHSGLEKAIANMEGQIVTLKTERTTKEAELRALEKQTTSVQPTIDGINGILATFGFRGFKLAPAPSGKAYKIVRANGSDAKATLSEGERTFVTFLYFYHLLKGSESESGMTTDRVVVFDDPVSSLDSEVLFIVSNLIKGLFDEVRAGAGHIRQIFVFTHNVYFHKEVTFYSKRKLDACQDETFWTVRKMDLLTRLEKHPSNPIKTSYDLLWDEVRRKDRSNLTIQNTLRRILENYFKILGGIDLDKLCNRFDGKERIICKTLVSWVNDGSHFAHDDLFVTIDSSQVDTYLAVFRAVFEKTNQLQHYAMMMGPAYVESQAGKAAGAEPTGESVQ